MVESPPRSLPHDTCVRCGRPTPLGVSLCEADNPGRIGAPSATQVHGTIVAGIIGGFVLFALVARLALAGFGPFEGTLLERAARPDGSVELVVRVSNGGSREAPATCRVSRGGLTAPDDLVFQTDRLAPGAVATYDRVARPDLAHGPYVLDRLAVRCT